MTKIEKIIYDLYEINSGFDGAEGTSLLEAIRLLKKYMSRIQYDERYDQQQQDYLTQWGVH